jgi:hypothetical protein
VRLEGLGKFKKCSDIVIRTRNIVPQPTTTPRIVIKYLHIILGTRYFEGKRSLIRRTEGPTVSDRLNIAIAGSDFATGLSVCLKILVFCVAAIDQSVFQRVTKSLKLL